MPHVTGIGGVFFKSKDAKALMAWYAKNLGITLRPWGGAVLRWSDDPGADKAATAWNVYDGNSDQFSPSQATFMINYRVDDLVGMIADLKKAGVKILKEPEASEFGKFASIMDPDGNRIELWEP
jgi:predicted enzyme related to lactoylglutathione lyase